MSEMTTIFLFKKLFRFLVLWFYIELQQLCSQRQGSKDLIIHSHSSTFCWVYRRTMGCPRHRLEITLTLIAVSTTPIQVDHRCSHSSFTSLNSSSFMDLGCSFWSTSCHDIDQAMSLCKDLSLYSRIFEKKELFKNSKFDSHLKLLIEGIVVKCKEILSSKIY